jgi:hypothetical protein
LLVQTDIIAKTPVIRQLVCPDVPNTTFAGQAYVGIEYMIMEINMFGLMYHMNK